MEIQIPETVDEALTLLDGRDVAHAAMQFLERQAADDPRAFRALVAYRLRNIERLLRRDGR